MKEKSKKQKGITLIALIITIIVMLILAMVSISIIKNQGIITKSKNAADTHQIAEEKEAIELAYSKYLIEKYNGKKATLIIENAEVTGNEENGWTITFNAKPKNTYKLSADGKTITGPGESSGVESNMETALKNFTSNPENYVHPEQSSTNKDRAIGTDGKSVNLDLWEYVVLDEENSTITLSTMNYACQDLGTSYSNDNIVNGKIKGTVPQYIFLEEKNKVYTVTSMLNTFRNCTNLEYAPEIPTTIRDLSYTFYGCTNLKETIKINSSIINNVYDCFANVLNNIKLQVPENSTTYNIFNETYGNSSNITIETFARELEWWWLTDDEKTEIIKEDYNDYYDIATNELGSDPGGAVVVLTITNNSNLYREYEKIEISISTEQNVKAYCYSINGEPIYGNNVELNKWYCHTWNSDGTQTFEQYNGPCPISKELFTQIYSESYLDRIIDSFK